MKYKVLILLGLMIGGLSLLSCNQQRKPQQTVEAVADEEPATEEKWDSIVVTYKYRHIDGTGSIIMYSDGTAMVGRNNGYWRYGSFYRGDSEFGYISITINKYDSFYEQYVDNKYFISQERDMVWTTIPNPYITTSDGYKDMVAKNREHGNDIVAWDIY